jgi:hypothetical protein
LAGSLDIVVSAARRGPRQQRVAQVQLALDAAARIILQPAVAQQFVQVLAFGVDELPLELVGEAGELLVPPGGTLSRRAASATAANTSSSSTAIWTVAIIVPLCARP